MSIQAQILNLLADLQGDFGLTYLFIAHDLEVVRHVSDQVAVMYLGRIVEPATRGRSTTTPRHPYTAALLSAAPAADPDAAAARQRIILTGDIPSPIDPPRAAASTPAAPRPRTSATSGTPARNQARRPPEHRTACHFPVQPGEDLTTTPPLLPPTLAPGPAARAVAHRRCGMSLTELEFQGETTGDGSAQVIEGRSPWVLAWRRLRQDKVAVASLVVILLLALLAILAPVIAAWVGHPPDTPYTNKGLTHRPAGRAEQHVLLRHRPPRPGPVRPGLYGARSRCWSGSCPRPSAPFSA